MKIVMAIGQKMNGIKNNKKNMRGDQEKIDEHIKFDT